MLPSTESKQQKGRPDGKDEPDNLHPTVQEEQESNQGRTPSDAEREETPLCSNEGREVADPSRSLVRMFERSQTRRHHA